MSAVLSLFLTYYLKDACRMLNLRIDSKSRTIFAEIQPAGEKEPIAFEILDYAFVEEQGATFLSFGRIKVSREWMERVVETVFPDRRLPLPPGVPAGLLKVVME